MNFINIGILVVVALVTVIQTSDDMNFQMILLLALGAMSFLALVIIGNQILNEDGEKPDNDETDADDQSMMGYRSTVKLGEPELIS